MCAANCEHVLMIPKQIQRAGIRTHVRIRRLPVQTYMVCLSCQHTLMGALWQAVLQAGYEMPQGEYLSTWSTIPADASGIGQVAGFPMHDVNAIDAKLKEAHCKLFCFAQ